MRDRFLRACRRQPVDRTPVWFMRQAGRYLPEYREIRGDRDILETCRHPEVVVELSLQPLRRMPLDAAIVFSDIMVPLEAIGIPIRVASGTGPVLEEPIRSEADLRRLRPLVPEEDEPYLLEAIRLLRAELQVPLIGFAGAPFTLASYLVEGRAVAGSGAHEGAPARRADHLGSSHGGPRGSLRDPPPGTDRGRGPGRPGLRSVGRDARAGGLRAGGPAVSAGPVFRGVADLGVPSIHFGVGTGELLRLDGRARGAT
ncbi:MAG: hypothetical protein KatS3mg014_0390 [Actinomycetota bacterium]|nr:MAG: hypothetical protein KatS3mg014_0390 [Actinomycetota bacterium]